MSTAMKLKKGDEVVVLLGRDKGKKGKISAVLPRDRQVIVDGVNVLKRHTKPGAKHPKGGILDVTHPMPAGKVALVCPNCKKPTRVGWQVNVKGDKHRVCRKCKKEIK